MQCLVLLLVTSVMQKHSVVVGLANELSCGRAPDLPLHHHSFKALHTDSRIEPTKKCEAFRNKHGRGLKRVLVGLFITFNLKL